MSANSATRAASFIFRPFAASAYRRYRIPNAAAAAAYHHHMSDFVPTRWAFLVDTLALVRGMEAQGIESKHAEAITSAITLVLSDTLESVAESCASKGELQKDMMIQDANLLKLSVKSRTRRIITSICYKGRAKSFKQTLIRSTGGFNKIWPNRMLPPPNS